MKLKKSQKNTVSVMGFWFAGLTVIVIGVLALFFYQKEISQWLFAQTESPPAVVQQAPIDVSKQTNESDDTSNRIK